MEADVTVIIPTPAHNLLLLSTAAPEAMGFYAQMGMVYRTHTNLNTCVLVIFFLIVPMLMTLLDDRRTVGI